MNCRRSHLLHVLLIAFLASIVQVQAQTKIRYHVFSPTSSIPILTQWNINNPDTSKWYIRETVDSKNRVTEIAFYGKQGIFDGFTCWEPSIVTFSYSKNTIIELRWDVNHNPLNADACYVPYKSIYHLNDCNKILWADRTYLENDSATVIRDSVYIKSIWYFNYSWAKMNGVNPTAPSSIPVEEETGTIPIMKK